MDKYSLYPGTGGGGSPRIHLIEPGTRYGMEETHDLVKTASGEHLPEVNELVESLQPQPDRLYLLNSALGSGEYVGFNLRGDWFTEEGLLHTPNGWGDIPVWDIDERRRRAHETEKTAQWGDLAWGFPTFYNAHRFRHHQNKDPNRAYGYVLGAFWDERMHRVILVTELIKALCDRLGAMALYDRIAQGEFPDTSMGAKVPFDRCSICNNHARSPARYCEHVNESARHPYGMHNILPDGRKCGVYNDYPRFFDDSYVFIGAERSAKTMSDLTNKVKGENPYSQKVYQYMPPVKVAGAPQAQHDTQVSTGHGPTGKGDQEQATSTLSTALGDVLQVPRPDDSLEDKLSRLLDGMPLSDPGEREVFRHLHDMERAKKRLESKDLSEREFGLLERMGKEKLKGLGISQGDINSAKNKAKQQKAQLLQKTSSTKLSDILKTIPLPSEHHLGTIRAHERQLPDLTDEQLDTIAENPGPRMRAAARLGVVLRPHEFQYSILKKTNPEEAASYKEAGVVFTPQPLTLNDPKYSASVPIPSGEEDVVRSTLSADLEKRSFAPVAVRRRLLAPQESPGQPELTKKEDDLLNKVSSLYNEYRAGLMARPPDWRYVPVDQQVFVDVSEEGKVAEASIAMSKDLLNLAYWPALPVG